MTMTAVRINAILEQAFIKAKKRLDADGDALAEIKAAIIAGLDGETAEGDKIIAAYTPEAVYWRYDDTLLETLVDRRTLDKCRTRATRAGYYSIRKKTA